MKNLPLTDLLSCLKEDGVCRIIPENHAFFEKLGMDRLLNQHQEVVDSDLDSLIPQGRYRQFELSHSDDKLFVMEEMQAWLAEYGLSGSDYLDSLVWIMDELIENSLYAAPRDRQGQPFYVKGQGRELGPNEVIRIDLVFNDDVLGLMVTDSWGTLVPTAFLQGLERAVEQEVIASIGGGGLYMAWCQSDYLQIRIRPDKQTRITVLWDLGKPFEASTDSGFQLLYHQDHEEVST